MAYFSGVPYRNAANEARTNKWYDGVPRPTTQRAQTISEILHAGSGSGNGGVENNDGYWAADPRDSAGSGGQKSGGSTFLGRAVGTAFNQALEQLKATYAQNNGATAVENKADTSENLTDETDRQRQIANIQAQLDYWDSENPEKQFDYGADALESALSSAKQQLAAMYAEQEKKLQKSRDEQLREEYVSQQQAERILPQQLSALGRSGGATQSTLADMQRTYENGRRSAHQNYDSNLSDALMSYRSALANTSQSFGGAIANAQSAAAQAAAEQAAEKRYQRAQLLAQLAALGAA